MPPPPWHSRYAPELTGRGDCAARRVQIAPQSCEGAPRDHVQLLKWRGSQLACLSPRHRLIFSAGWMRLAATSAPLKTTRDAKLTLRVPRSLSRSDNQLGWCATCAGSLARSETCADVAKKFLLSSYLLSDFGLERARKDDFTSLALSAPVGRCAPRRPTSAAACVRRSASWSSGSSLLLEIVCAHSRASSARARRR